MATLLPAIADYTGVDVVPQLIAQNEARYGSASVRFLQRDVALGPLPYADAILCRDCLVHLPTAAVLRAIDTFLATGARYLLTTTFPDTAVNRDVLTGAWRPLNLERPPFAFGRPLVAIREHAPEDTSRHADKTLALWALDDLRRIRSVRAHS
jgi:hypothetical protein